MATRKKRGGVTPKRPTGMRQGLATYGDAGFSLFLRKAFLDRKSTRLNSSHT